MKISAHLRHHPARGELSCFLFFLFQWSTFLFFFFSSCAHFRSVKSIANKRFFTYSWYHFLSRYFAMSWEAVPVNCCASFAIFSALSSSLLSLSPRSTINMWARLTSLDADVALVPSSWIFEFGPTVSLATERFGLPLAVSPTVKIPNQNHCLMTLWAGNLHNSSRSMLFVPPPNSPLKKLSFGGSGISHWR